MSVEKQRTNKASVKSGQPLEKIGAMLQKREISLAIDRKSTRLNSSHP